MKSKKSNLWLLMFLLLVGLTIYVIIGQSKSFSFDNFIFFLKNISWQWIALAFVFMFGFIYFEGLAIISILKAFGYKRKSRNGIMYSAPDLYFSAITPSATGGQPASAYFMVKDGIPAAVATIALLINLTLYTTSIILIGIVCFALGFDNLIHFGKFSKLLIIVGFSVQFVLLALFVLLIYNEKIVKTFGDFCLNVLKKLHLVKKYEKKKKKLDEMEKQYKECADLIVHNKKAIFKALLFNIAQRLSQIFVSVSIFVGVTKSSSNIVDAFAAQGFVVLGSNSVPIPGSVGIADYLYIDGFGHLIKDPICIELLSRGISFYCCVFISAIITLTIYMYQSMKGIKQKKKC